MIFLHSTLHQTKTAFWLPGLAGKRLLQGQLYLLLLLIRVHFALWESLHKHTHIHMGLQRCTLDSCLMPVDLPWGALVNISSLSVYCLVIGYDIVHFFSICSLNSVYGMEIVAVAWRQRYGVRTRKRTRSHTPETVGVTWLSCSCNCKCAFPHISLKIMFARPRGPQIVLSDCSLLTNVLCRRCWESAPVGMQQTSPLWHKTRFIDTYFSALMSTIRGNWVALAPG